MVERNGADLVPLTIADINGSDSETRQISQELRIQTAEDARLDYTLGAYYFAQEVDTFTIFRQADLNSPILFSQGLVDRPLGAVPPQFLDSDLRANFDNAAVFGEANYAVTDTVDILGGFRLVRDNVQGRQETMSDLLPFPSGVNTGEVEETFLIAKAGLEYRPTEDILAFFTYNRGYKGPALQIDGGALISPTGQLTSAEPEKPTQYEIGVRSSWFNNRLRLNANAFWIEVDDLQGGTDLGSLGNVPAAQSRGIELEYVVLPASFVRFFGNVSFLDAEIEDFPNGPCYPGQTPTKGCVNGVQDLAGATLPNAPDFSFDVNVEFNYPLEQIDSELFAFISYFYQDDVQFFLQNNPATVQEAYGVLDFNAGLTVRERYEASIFVSNVLDKDYATLVGVNDFSGIIVEAGFWHQLALDRRFGGRLRVTF